MKRLNKKGFTLIELLAVIVILAVLLAIAVPSVTNYINTSRRSAYVDTILSYVDAARGALIVGDQYNYPVNANDATVFSFKTLKPKLEKGGNSSYGNEFVEANSCVIVVQRGTGENPRYVFYVAAKDSGGYGLGATGAIPRFIESNNLKPTDVFQFSGGISCPAIGATDVDIPGTSGLVTGAKVRQSY